MFLIKLALIGGLFSLLIFLSIWFRSSRSIQERFNKLVWIATFITLDLIMFGSFTRLTDSGLGCPDWPGCYGAASPFSAHNEIKAAAAAFPDGPVTMLKAWIEMLHRYFALGLGALIVMILILSICYRKQLQIKPIWPGILLILIIIQGAFGAWTVTMKLQPAIVSIHLLLGVLLLCMLGWFAADQNRAGRNEIKPNNISLGKRNNSVAIKRDVLAGMIHYRWLLAIAIFLVFFQIALGGWVSANYAVLACPDFPLCHGQWIPPMDFAQGFHLWRELGQNSHGEMISSDALTAIHWVHRVFAIGVVAYLLCLSGLLYHYRCLKKLLRGLFVLTILQVLTGLSNIIFQWPLLNAVVHNGGAALMALLLTLLLHRVIYTNEAYLASESARDASKT